jgi:predicted dehydrogenase
MTQRVLHIGAGGFGEVWCGEFLPANVADGTVEVVGLADIDATALERGRQLLSLPAQCCYTDIDRAFAEVEADFCTIVVPPAHHEAMVDRALARGMDILSEKPIADTMEASVRIADKVRNAGRKMAVTMSHRFDQDKATLRALVRSGRLGPLSAVAGRLASDFRIFDSWRRFRHEMVHPLLIEGAVHHLDIIADLAGAPCTSIFARTWRPDWAEYAGDTDAIVVMDFANDVHAVYEGSASDPAGLNDWRYEYFRVDGEHGTAILDHREVELFMRTPGVVVRQASRTGAGQKLPLVSGPKWANALLIEQFARWRDGGPVMETDVESNLRSVILVFAAVESAVTGKPVDIDEFVQRYR